MTLKELTLEHLNKIGKTPSDVIGVGDTENGVFVKFEDFIEKASNIDLDLLTGEINCYLTIEYKDGSVSFSDDPFGYPYCWRYIPSVKKEEFDNINQLEIALGDQL